MQNDPRESMGSVDVIAYALDNLPRGYEVRVTLVGHSESGGEVTLTRGAVVVPFARPLGLCDGILEAVDHARRIEGLPDFSWARPRGRAPFQERRP